MKNIATYFEKIPPTQAFTLMKTHKTHMVNENTLTVVGKANFHGDSRLFGIKLDDRRRHMHVMGKTGMGKTSFLLNMAVSDINNGHGFAFIDPHGDVTDDILNYIPEHRINDVVYFSPADMEYPLAFNVLGDVPKNQRHIVADGLVGVFQKIWADSWGPRLEYILRNTINTLLIYPNTTLLDIMRILVDKEYRKEVVNYIDDPVLKSFWINEFNKYNDKMVTEAISPIQNKVGQFTSSPLIRNIIGQQTSSFDIREIMDSRKILLMNLSKGAVGEGGAQLLGAMMITKMQLAAMSRVDILQENRVDFFAYVDEFQNFSTDSFAEILSEARKYRLGLILAHQYIEQLSDAVRAAVFGNVGTTALFRIGAGDAEFMEKEFGPNLTAEDLVNLPKYHMYLKLMIDGVTSKPFMANTLPNPPYPPINYKDQIIEHSRTTYGRHIDSVAQTISANSTVPDIQSTNKKPASNSSKTLVWKNPALEGNATDTNPPEKSSTTTPPTSTQAPNTSFEPTNITIEQPDPTEETTPTQEENTSIFLELTQAIQEEIQTKSYSPPVPEGAVPNGTIMQPRQEEVPQPSKTNQTKQQPKPPKKPNTTPSDNFPPLGATNESEASKLMAAKLKQMFSVKETNDGQKVYEIKDEFKRQQEEKERLKEQEQKALTKLNDNQTDLPNTTVTDTTPKESEKDGASSKSTPLNPRTPLQPNETTRLSPTPTSSPQATESLSSLVSDLLTGIQDEHSGKTKQDILHQAFHDTQPTEKRVLKPGQVIYFKKKN